MKILLAVTFVFGVVHLITLTKLFDYKFMYIFKAFFGFETNRDTRFIGRLFDAIQVWFFYFSLVFQAWYWLFK